jgi:hypothetical protein
LREGDLVIGRDEETGVSGAFPVTALMSRTAPEVIWLTLENVAGSTSRMGVTSEHPMFLVGDGWTDAGDVVSGDLIRDKDLQPLTVLAVQVDDAPTQVHNLEIAEAHTYFAGELEAWGHNVSWGEVQVRLMQLVTGCFLEAANPDIEIPTAEGGVDVFSPDFEGDPKNPRPPRKPTGQKGKTCPLYPPKNPTNFQPRNTGKW